ncbi:MAG: CapA family protein [Ruminococcaceae bacterium]|nr:CapA family protein [Oscillospiraceae bacterium]
MKRFAGFALCAALLLSSCVDMRSSTTSPDYDSSVDVLRDTLYSGIASAVGENGLPEGASLFVRGGDALPPMAAETEENALSTVEAPADRFAFTDISFAAVGDNLIHPNLYTDAYNRGNADKRYDFLPLYSHIAPMIAEADFAYINQETPMAGEAYGYSGWPNFNSPQQLGVDLCEVGFDIVNIANNHMLDKGAGGYASTLDFWHTQPVTLIGGYYNAEDAASIRTVEKDGAVIALLAYTYGTNSISLPWGSEMVVPYIADELILSDLAKAEEAADFTIVSIHWGNETTQTPTDEQKRLAQLIADHGGDVILGTHSHTLQPLTWLKSQTTGKEVLCIYSLGNFASGQARPVNMVGGILTFDIKGDGDNGLCVKNVLFTPTVNYYGGDWYSTKIYPLSEYTAEIAATHGVQWQGYGSLSPEGAAEFVTNVIPTEFLPDYMK